MNPLLVLGLIAAYFVLLVLLGRWTSRRATNATFFTADRNSPWWLVAFGMVGVSLSGITFLSVPGQIGTNAMAYMQMVLGYLVGYAVIALVLLPIYYRMGLTSIYTYLEHRLGFYSYKTGAFFFLLSRTLGAAVRLYLVALVLHAAVMEPLGIPFWAAVLVAIVLIWTYTHQGGIKTIVYTDALQTAVMLLAAGVSIVLIAQATQAPFGELVSQAAEKGYFQVFFFSEPNSPSFFWKEFAAGVFIPIGMTGLDQDMMQKNLTCRNLRDAQKNMLGLAAGLVPVNLLFLFLGALLFLFAGLKGIPLPEEGGDLVFQTIALEHLPALAGVFFVLGVSAAAYSSADSALTSLTTSLCFDFLNFGHRHDEARKKQVRQRVHVGFSLVLFLVILVFHWVGNKNALHLVFRLASYTYGPLLGMFFFGILTRRQVRDRYLPAVALAAPLLCLLLSWQSENWLGGYSFGFELLLLNGLFTFIGCLLLSRPQPAQEASRKE